MTAQIKLRWLDRDGDRTLQYSVGTLKYYSNPNTPPGRIWFLPEGMSMEGSKLEYETPVWLEVPIEKVIVAPMKKKSLWKKFLDILVRPEGEEAHDL